MTSVPLILASSSAYRRELLLRFGIPFTQEKPEVDESSRPGESPSDLALRLAKNKAMKVAEKHQNALIIGSDQVATCGGVVYSKPGDMATAKRQLSGLSGQALDFHTALCVIHRPSNRCQIELAVNRVTMRPLLAEEITRYLTKEDALCCAGAARFEGLGIALLEKYDAGDPTALMGLPLVALGRMLRAEGCLLP